METISCSKLDPSGNVLLVLGRINTGAKANWLFNRPADVAFANNGDIYVADGYGNSRVVKFDRDGNYIKAWGKYGAGIGEFNLPHSVAVDKEGREYVGDRGNQRYKSLMRMETSFNNGLESAIRMVWCLQAISMCG